MGTAKEKFKMCSLRKCQKIHKIKKTTTISIFKDFLDPNRKKSDQKNPKNRKKKRNHNYPGSCDFYFFFDFWDSFGFFLDF